MTKCNLYNPCRNNQYRCDDVAGYRTKEEACAAYALNPQGYVYAVCGQSCSSCDSAVQPICDSPDQKGATPGWGSFGGREASMNLIITDGMSRGVIVLLLVLATIVGTALVLELIKLFKR